MTITSLALYYWANPVEMVLPFSFGFGIWAGLRGDTTSPNFSVWGFRFTVWSLMFIYGLVSAIFVNGIISFTIVTIATGILINEIIDAYNVRAAIASHRIFKEAK